MKSFTRRKTILFAVTFTLMLAIHSAIAAQSLPNPVLAFIRQETIEKDGKQTIRYYFEVANKNTYPAEIFAPAPGLPPCGQNANSSRTWIDILDQRGKRLNGFCNLTKREDLDKLWFSLPGDEVPPSWVYIEFTDRQTNTKYKSNLAETTQ